MTFKHIQITYYTILILFTMTVLLLSFVVPYGGFNINENNDYILPDENQEPLAYNATRPEILEHAAVIGRYESNTALITIYVFQAYESNVFVADVVVKQAEVIRAGLAYNIFGGANYVQRVSDMAEERNAIFAINSDYANHYDTGLVIRNGQVLRTTQSYRDATALFTDGTVRSFAETSTTAETLEAENAWHVWSFGPILVQNYLAVASINDGVRRNAVDNPRSAFGWISDFHYMYVVVDGRSDISLGVDVAELAQIMLMLDVKEAYNFDGGGSATMYFDGRVINTPSQGAERRVGDCVYIIG